LSLSKRAAGTSAGRLPPATEALTSVDWRRG
jgi:hypothetical protein